MRFGYLAGALLMIPLFCFMILPFLNGDFDELEPHVGRARRHDTVEGEATSLLDAGR